LGLVICHAVGKASVPCHAVGKAHASLAAYFLTGLVSQLGSGRGDIQFASDIKSDFLPVKLLPFNLPEITVNSYQIDVNKQVQEHNTYQIHIYSQP